MHPEQLSRRLGAELIGSLLLAVTVGGGHRSVGRRTSAVYEIQR